MHGRVQVMSGRMTMYAAAGICKACLAEEKTAYAEAVDINHSAELGAIQLATDGEVR